MTRPPRPYRSMVAFLRFNRSMATMLQNGGVG